MEGKIFFSYARSDASFALKLAKDLRAANLSVWIDQIDIPPGAPWDREVEQALRACVAVVVVLSPDAAASRSVMDEVSFAVDHDKKVLPVIYKKCEVPFRLRRLQHVDFTPTYSAGLLAITHAFEGEQSAATTQDATESATAAIEDIHGREVVGEASAIETRPGLQGVSFPPTRFRTSLWIGLVGGVSSVAVNVLIYANDPRRSSLFGSRERAFDATAIGGGIVAGLLWAVAGAVAGPTRSSLASAVITSLVVLGFWVGVFGTYSDVLWTAVSFGVPLGGIVGAFFSRWILKRKVSS
jgi:hypothetical protein